MLSFHPKDFAKKISFAVLFGPADPKLRQVIFGGIFDVCKYFAQTPVQPSKDKASLKPEKFF